jgi:hypothetical protein
MQELEESGRVRRWPLATTGRGCPNYYVLTRLGYALLHGEGVEPPTKHAFSEVRIARQFHTFALADFLTHTVVAAHLAGIALSSFVRENTFKLQVGEECLYPDCGFDLLPPAGPELEFFTEVDNSTERIRTEKDIDNWQRKIRLYDAFQDACPQRFRVLIVATRSSERVRHILEAASTLVRNPHRSLFYGVYLPAYLAAADPLHMPCFRDHRGQPASLVPQVRRGLPVVPVSSPLAVA